MKNTKNILITIAIYTIFIISIFYYWNFSRDKEVLLQIKPNYEVQTKRQENNNQTNELPVVNEKINKKEVTLSVLDKTYNIKIKDGDTVYEAMNNAQNLKENNFSFKAKEYPGLGIFVDEINGIKGTLGKYWIYYVNNKEASVSISKYVLNDGDIINWKQE